MTERAAGNGGGDAMTGDDAFFDDDFCLANGLGGETLTIPSANPKNFYQAISDTDPARIRSKPTSTPSGSQAAMRPCGSCRAHPTASTAQPPSSTYRTPP